MSTVAELDDLLLDRFGITTTDFVDALKSLPTARPWACSLTEEDARLLDDAGLVEDLGGLVAVSTESAGHQAHLVVASFTAAEVAAGLGVTAARVRQKRLAGELWAFPHGRRWMFPLVQFETDDTGRPVRQIRGMGRVFKSLPPDLHPVTVARFLCTPQPGLFQRRPMTPVLWLRDAGDVDRAVAVAMSIDWYTA
jgi:hypothetical protein